MMMSQGVCYLGRDAPASRERIHHAAGLFPLFLFPSNVYIRTRGSDHKTKSLYIKGLYSVYAGQLWPSSLLYPSLHLFFFLFFFWALSCLFFVAFICATSSTCLAVYWAVAAIGQCEQDGLCMECNTNMTDCTRLPHIPPATKSLPPHDFHALPYIYILYESHLIPLERESKSPDLILFPSCYTCIFLSLLLCCVVLYI